MSRAAIAQRLGRTEQSVKSRARALGLRGQIQPVMGPRATKNRIVQAIVDNGGPLTINAIAATIEVSRTLVHQHILDMEREGRLQRAGLGETPRGRGRAPVLWDCVTGA